MVLIFIGSTSLMTPNHTGSLLQNFLAIFSIHLDRATMDHVNHIVRKCGHVCEYSVLALLAARVFLTSSRTGLRRWWWICSLAVVIVFASTDEYHQTFVPGREGQVKDDAIDTAGGAAALTLLAIVRSIYIRRQRPGSRASRRRLTLQSTRTLAIFSASCATVNHKIRDHAMSSFISEALPRSAYVIAGLLLVHLILKAIFSRRWTAWLVLIGFVLLVLGVIAPMVRPAYKVHTQKNGTELVEWEEPYWTITQAIELLGTSTIIVGLTIELLNEIPACLRKEAGHPALRQPKKNSDA